MNDKKRLTFKIEILVIILLLILLICNMIMLNSKKNKLKTYNNDDNIQIEKLPDYLKMPKKSYAFLADYYGNISMITAYKSFYELAYNTIPMYFRELKNKKADEIGSYYTQNKTEIYTKCGITSKDEFTKLINYISKLKGENLEVDSFEFEKESIKINGDQTSADLNIIYKDNSGIKINVTLLKDISEGAIIKIKCSN